MRKERRKMKISKKWIRLCNIICAVLMVALLVLQFLPYWTFPNCVCETECQKLKYNKDCELCRAYYKVCVMIPEDELAVNKDRLDYTKTWDLSIQQYTWTPTYDSCDGATEYFDWFFKDQYNDKDFEFKVKDIVLMPVVVLVCAVLGLYFCLFKGDKPLVGIIPLLAGVAGILGYLTVPVFQVRNLIPNMWMVHLGVACAIAVFSLVPMLECVFRAINWCNPKKAQ